MSAATKPAAAEKTKRQRSPQHVAATACIDLSKLDDADARAVVSAKERTERRAEILGALSTEERKMVDAMRSAVKTP